MLLTGLRGRIALSYVAVSVVTILLPVALGLTITWLHDPWGVPPLGGSLAALVALLVFFTPVGIGFGLLTMWSPVRRLRRLVAANEDLANGTFSRRVAVGARDEMAQLERQFNATAARLEEATLAQQSLAADRIRLEERARIARDLHESVSQDLYALRMRLGGMEMARAGDPALAAELGALQSTVATAIRQMRAMLLELRPLELRDLDLATSLRELVAVYEHRIGLVVDAEIDDGVRVEGAWTEALTRIAHEALANAIRHSRARRVALELARGGGDVRLRVADDGHGFDVDAAGSRGGLGLTLIRERAAQIGAEVGITSGRSGTEVTVTLPGGGR